MAGISATAVAIQAVDTGNGSYVTISWPTIFAGAPIVIPTTAPPSTPPPSANWASSPTGVFGTTDRADRISYTIDHNVEPVTLVMFRLVIGAASSGWWKGIQLLVIPALK